MKACGGDYLAIGAANNIVAIGYTRSEAKNRAIAKGITSPLVVQARDVKKFKIGLNLEDPFTKKYLQSLN